MSLADDRRGRVPFALVGVLLLVGASVYATELTSRGPATVERPAGESMDAAIRDARPALRAAVRTAARGAAANPVTAPADTPVGQTINGSQPFVDALRVRIAVAARERLATVERRRGGVRTTASLPPITDPNSLREAKRAVRVTPIRNDGSIRVTVRGVTVRATHDDRTLARRTANVTLVVSTPVLALHERAENYETRLNRGPLAGPGLGRGLTARLYPITWARAYGRYGGAPIRNVLGNRHVELSTNTALLAQQRAVFGRNDPDGARAVQVATARVAVTDVLGSSPETDRVTRLLRPNAVDDAGGFAPETPERLPLNASPSASSDDAYLEVAGESLARRLRRSYRVDASLETDVTLLVDGSQPQPNAPGENWTLLGTTEKRRTTVREQTDSAQPQSASESFLTTKTVVVTHTATHHWAGEEGVRRTTARWTTRYRVVVAVRTEYAPRDAAPDRRTAHLFRRGGALDGDNLAATRERATADLLGSNGGADAVAKRVVHDRTLSRSSTVVGEPPTGLRPWVEADLLALRDRIANETVTVPRRAVAAGDAVPAAQLAERLRERRAALVDAPARYDGVADRARVAARTAYVDAVIQALEDRAAESDGRNRDYLDRVGDRAAGDLSRLVAVGAGGDHEPIRRADGSSEGSRLATVPDGSPAYLTLEPISSDHVPTVEPGESVHPLAARTTNWFALPYGDAADGIVGAVFPGERVSLGTAGQTLVAANRTAESGETGEHERQRYELAGAVAESLRTVEAETCTTLRADVEVPRPDCRRAVDAANRRWPALGHRALAVANGSYVEAVGAALPRDGVDRGTTAEATVRLRVRHRELLAEDSTAVEAAVVNGSVSSTRGLGRTAAREVVKAGLENASERATRRLTGSARLPAGLPVAPAPGHWYATVNAWSVTVRGEYQRFAVRGYAGGPDGSGAVVRYVRDGDAVTLDVDGDGTPERLGRSERIAFETRTTVVVAVPPGPPGVGDVDGDRDERSPGWPCPGKPGEEVCASETD